MKTVLRSAACIIVAGLLQTVARADAIPPPAELNDVQKVLIGSWTESQCAVPWGHACNTRTIAFGNDTVAIVGFGGIEPSQDYHTSAESGSWAAAEAGKAKITIGTAVKYEITLETGGFARQDISYPDIPVTHFVRSGEPVIKE